MSYSTRRRLLAAAERADAVEVARARTLTGQMGEYALAHLPAGDLVARLDLLYDTCLSGGEIAETRALLDRTTAVAVKRGLVRWTL